MQSSSSVARRRALGIVSAVAALFCAPALAAKPITYTGFTITDGQLGSWAFHNARVYLTLKTDTDDTQFMQPPIDPTDPTAGTVDAYLNASGTASVTVISGTRSVRATFDPNQIFVSLDEGDTDGAPHLGARGLGFGSFSATAPGGIEPAYPLGVEDGTVDWGDIVEDGPPAGIASDELMSLETDLKGDVGFSGRAWACPGFPGACVQPSAPLTTDHGDFYLYQPYVPLYPPEPLSPGGSMNAGFFWADTSGACDADDERSALPLLSVARKSSAAIRYNAFVIADVSLGKLNVSGAQVYLSFDADPTKATTFTQGDAHGYINSAGTARVNIVGGGRSITAEFQPNQLYIVYDLAHASIGFGSSAGGNAYPLTIAAHEDLNGLTESSTVGAATSITLGTVDPTDHSYSSATTGLTTDLTNATVLSGAASSCAAFDPVTTICTNSTPVALRTNRGDFRLSQPYTADNSSSDGSQPYSVNWGVFWSEIVTKGRH
jgi:hypothetical protein